MLVFDSKNRFVFEENGLVDLWIDYYYYALSILCFVLCAFLKPVPTINLQFICICSWSSSENRHHPRSV